jgi:hypothetical protein
MLEEPVYNTCSQDPSSIIRKGGLSLVGIADYIQGLGVPDTLADL